MFAVNAESLTEGIRERTSLRNPQLKPKEGVGKEEVCLETVVLADTKEHGEPNRKHSFTTVGDTNAVPGGVTQVDSDMAAGGRTKVVSGGESRGRVKDPCDGAHDYGTGKLIEHGGNITGVSVGTDPRGE